MRAEDNQSIIAQPSDHIEIEHCFGFLHGHRRMLDIARRSEKTKLFSGKGREYNRACGPPGGSTHCLGNAHDNARSRRIIIRTVMNFSFPAAIQTSVAAKAQMVVMRPDDDGFPFELRVRARQYPDYVFGPAGDRLEIYGKGDIQIGHWHRSRPFVIVDLLFEIRERNTARPEHWLDDCPRDLSDNDAVFDSRKAVSRGDQLPAIGP